MLDMLVTSVDISEMNRPAVNLSYYIWNYSSLRSHLANSVTIGRFHVAAIAIIPIGCMKTPPRNCSKHIVNVIVVKDFQAKCNAGPHNISDQVLNFRTYNSDFLCQWLLFWNLKILKMKGWVEMGTSYVQFLESVVWRTK